LVIDIDSTVCAVEGHNKRRTAFGYTKVLGYHPILASRADTGEILHARMRIGVADAARGARRFTDELSYGVVVVDECHHIPAVPTAPRRARPSV
jgi:hypothetical protein